MKKFLSKIRTPDMNMSFESKAINTFLIFLLGIALGMLSKWLDEFRDDGTILWQILNGTLDLANVFSEFGIWLFIAIEISVFSKTPLRASLNAFLFFVGMTVSYHLYTIYFCGFNPKRYMMIWYGITPVMKKFLKENNLLGKDVIVATSNTGWIGYSIKDYKTLVKGNIKGELDLVFSANQGERDKMLTTTKELDNWIEKL